MKFINSIIDQHEKENFFVFSSEMELEGDDKSIQGKKIRVYPYALSWVSDPTRPVLLFQDKPKSFSLPIAMSHLEAGIAIAQNSPNLPETNPHRVMEALVSDLGVSIQECLFTEVRGHYQYAQLTYEIAGSVKQLHLRADEVVSAALGFKIPFYTTAEFIQSSRVMSTNMEALGKDPQMQLQLLNRPGTYLM